MNKLFNIVLTGAFAQGTDPKAAIADFAKASGISVEKAQSLFNNAPSIIKRNASEATANAYQRKLTSLGVVTQLQAVESQIESKTESEPAHPNRPTAPEQQPHSIHTPGEREVSFKFTGEGYEYFKIWIVNLLLTIVTLGIYSPWAKVRNIQYFYGNTSLDGASFSFTADPVKMLIGRLIAMALFIAYVTLNAFNPIAGAILGIGLLFVFPWVLNRTLAFYARNSTYRNIRFRFTGTYWPAFKYFFLWPLAGVLSLMILMPLALQKQQCYITNHHNYGNKSFSFSATAGSYYKMCFLAFALVLAGGAAGGLLGLLYTPLGAFGIAIGYVAAIVFFIVTMNNLVLNNLSLAEHSFKANYRIGSFAILLISNFLLILLTLGLYLPWAKVKLAHYAAEHTALDVQGDLNQFVAISQPDASAFGEEFGDVFDMDVAF